VGAIARSRAIAGCGVICGCGLVGLGRLVVGASLLGYLGTPLLVHRMAASLGLVAGTGMGYLFAFLSGDIMANLPGDLSLHLILYSLAVLLGIIPGHLSVFSFALLSVFSMAALLRNLITFLP